jgi:hypothetical protein
MRIDPQVAKLLDSRNLAIKFDPTPTGDSRTFGRMTRRRLRKLANLIRETWDQALVEGRVIDMATKGSGATSVKGSPVATVPKPAQTGPWTKPGK